MKGNDMRTIAFVTQKGGSGKSTIASSLAVTALEAGERVFILDMDPQQSLVKWSKTRGEADIPVEAVSPAKLGAALTALAKNGITLCIIDTAGTDSPATTAAMKAADFCVIPARPNVFDLWASESTRKALKDLRKDYAFLLNQCPPSQQSARVQDGVETLEAMGGLLAPLVSSRVDYQEAARHGFGVSELNPSGQAADEMRKLWASIKRRMTKGAKPAAATRKAA
jgi:chromosome partitioning protein